MQILILINLGIALLFLLCYMFQMVYIFVPLFAKKKDHKPTQMHRYAIIICARNEEAVIDDLFEGIYNQDYPSELVDIVLVADNCTDNTANRARELGAKVYERFDEENIGKGYALDYGLKCIDSEFGEDAYDAFIVFDADNLPEKNFITEINKTFSDGYEVVTSYRSSKNYGDSWLSAGSGLWFLRESKCLNGSRAAIGACPQVSGTGFLFSNKIKKENGGWPFHTLAEDFEFTCESVTRGKKFGYCADAVFYDEQVAGFKDAWNQRIRWVKGGLQSFGKYWKKLLRGIFSKNFMSSYDMFMSLAPAYVISTLACAVNLIGPIVFVCLGENVFLAFLPPVLLLLVTYFFVLIHSILTTITEWKYIKAKKAKKIKYMFTFPIYMLTFIPIAITAIFKKSIVWKPIKHKPAGRAFEN